MQHFVILCGSGTKVSSSLPWLRLGILLASFQNTDHRARSWSFGSKLGKRLKQTSDGKKMTCCGISMCFLSQDVSTNSLKLIQCLLRLTVQLSCSPQAITASEPTLRQMLANRGVVPILTASFQGTDSVIAKALVKAKEFQRWVWQQKFQAVKQKTINPTQQNYFGRYVTFQNNCSKIISTFWMTKKRRQQGPNNYCVLICFNIIWRWLRLPQ